MWRIVKSIAVSLEIEVFRVNVAPRVKEDKLDSSELWEPRANRATLASQDWLASMELLESRASRVTRDPEDQRATPEWLRRETKVMQDSMDAWVVQDDRARRERPDHQERMVRTA